MIATIITILAIIAIVGVIAFGIHIIFAAPTWIIVLFFVLIVIFLLCNFLLER